MRAHTPSVRYPPIALAALLLAGACASPSPQPAVPVHGQPVDLEVLAGDWWGEFTSAQTGRSGRIHFSVDPGSGLATGEVTMIPAGPDARPFRPANAADEATDRAARPLTVRFVQIRSGDETVTGVMEPYEDPDCGCIVSTTFVGRVGSDTIEGTFISHGGDGHPTTMGRWRVDRTRPKAAPSPEDG